MIYADLKAFLIVFLAKIFWSIFALPEFLGWLRHWVWGRLIRMLMLRFDQVALCGVLYG
jgi:hypothetical protein